MKRLQARRAQIRRVKLREEQKVVEELLRACALGEDDRRAIVGAAVSMVEGARARRHERPAIDGFLQEYGLSNAEGVALMCLAEALMRVPDASTRDDLISDKITAGDWYSHLGKSDTPLVNVSTLGLALTDHVAGLDEIDAAAPVAWLGRLTNRLGEPVIRAAMMQAMRILGNEFVLGQTIESAIQRGRKIYPADQLYSFDMLGEGARTEACAERNFRAYADAIAAIGARDKDLPLSQRSGVSIKLSALYPRYEYAKKDAVLDVLGDRAHQLAMLAAQSGIGLSIDAEEADRIDLSLDLFEQLASASDLGDWRGLGFVVQAYSKRALAIIDWLDLLAEETGRCFCVRLVKGAYWDSEIKHAQEQGLSGFPVFTRKSATDLSYLVCAQELIKRRGRLYCQFATHNAHTICALMHMAGGDLSNMELQRLHGMGDLVFGEAKRRFSENLPQTRVYAPVGEHKDLLAYLVRRLLENGANSSFVHRFLDKSVAPADVVADPVAALRAVKDYVQPQIRLPKNLFGERQNSTGLDLAAQDDVERIEAAIENERGALHNVHSLIPGASPSGDARTLFNPADRSDKTGAVRTAIADDIERAISVAGSAQPVWDQQGGGARARRLYRMADLLEAQKLSLMAILIREAGKTYSDALAEVREAVDFCRYYAAQAEAEFAAPQDLPGPTGEDNSISLHGRGIFACISPWNFPLAIFTGQVAAALAAGNAVIAKPAEQTPIIAFEAVKLFHRSGVPEEALQLALGDGGVGAALVAHEKIAGVAFTGGIDTAHAINRALAAKDGPIAPLIAETGGQNVMFVDSTALLEQVTDDVIQSAFLSAGQRCSALRVLYLQDDIADEALKMIRGAMDMLDIGDPSKFSNDIGPIIDAPALDALRAHIETMRQSALSVYKSDSFRPNSEGYFLAPHLMEIRSISQLSREHFGPILHVVRYKARELDNALQEAFSTGYGLTLGVHTRMDHRWRHIFARAPVGNTYVNRNMVGAVVGAQPFGGQGLSGTGFKAGGPRYLYRFASEKSLSVNTMASGGNAELLTLNE